MNSLSMHPGKWAESIERILREEVKNIVAKEARLAAERVAEQVKALAPEVGARVCTLMSPDNRYGVNSELNIVVKCFNPGEKFP